MQKQRVTIPLSGGIASGTDGKQLQIGRSEELQNVRVGRVGEVTQRSGTSALGNTFLSSIGGVLPQPWAIGTLRGDLVSFSTVGDHPANLYSRTANAWATDAATSGSTSAAIHTQRRGPILTSLDQISGNGLFPDSVDSNGYRFVIYQATRNGVAMVVTTVIDIATGMQIIEKTHAGTFVAYGVRVVNGWAVFIYATTALFTVETWSGTTPGIGVQTTFTSAKTVASGTRIFDMIAVNSTTISAAYYDGTNVQCFDYVPLAGSATFWTPKDSAAANITAATSLSWMQDIGFGASGKIALNAISVGPGLRTLWDIPTAGATRQAASTYALDAALTSGAVSGFTRTSDSTGEFTVVHENGNSGVNIVRIATRESGVIALATLYRNLTLNSKAFIGADGEYYIAADFVSTTQPTRFVVRVPRTVTGVSRFLAVVAKMQVNNGYVSSTAIGPLCPVSNPAPGEYTFSNTVQLRLPSNPTGYVPQGVGIDVVHVRFKSPLPDTTTGAPREGIDSLFTPGGIVGQFDGRTYCDAGFNYYPEQPAITPSATGGGLANAQTYYYALVYRWIDANGRTWRSKPSVLKSQVTLGSAPSTVASNSLACPTYRLADRDDIAIEVYRGGANNSTTLQLVGTVVNDPTVDSVTFNDTFSDAVVANGEQLYTNGTPGNQPLGADGIPGTTFLTIAGNRAYFVSNDNPYEVWVSNLFIPGQGWRFSEQNKITINDSFGPCYAIGAQPSGVVVIFKANCYYLVSGDGPNQAGNGGSFTVSRPIVGAGTINPRSVLETPSGIEYLSGGTSRAWYRVNTANQTEYIGSPIERYAAATIVGAVLVPSTGETRYYTSTGNTGNTRSIVHDTITDVWTTDVSPDTFGTQAAACAYGSGAAFAANARIWVDDTSNPGFDGPTQFTVYTITPWIKGSDLDGYSMFREARGVGESPGGLLTNLLLQADFDVGTNLAAESATTGPYWDWAIKYPAKLSSFRFVVSYLAPAVAYASQPKLSAIVAEYGVKAGFVPASYTKRAQ